VLSALSGSGRVNARFIVRTQRVELTLADAIAPLSRAAQAESPGAIVYRALRGQPDYAPCDLPLRAFCLRRHSVLRCGCARTEAGLRIHRLYLAGPIWGSAASGAEEQCSDGRRVRESEMKHHWMERQSYDVLDASSLPHQILVVPLHRTRHSQAQCQRRPLRAARALYQDLAALVARGLEARSCAERECVPLCGTPTG
jgi:hypothetical protein